MAEMTYAEALGWLHGLGRFGVQLGLERIAAVLARLGDPQRRFAALHIAGTNGKGSTAALCASLLCAAGRAVGAAGRADQRVGLYTSPHLLRVTERARLSDENGALRECPPGDLARALSAVRGAMAEEPAQPLTFFEAITAAAFLWFAQRGAAVVVVETGLGGRLDATRLCEPAATCVTSIGFDHAEWLGATLPQIAREKAGIFRPGVPALVACNDAGALDALRQEAGRLGAPLRVYPEDVPPLPPELAAAVPLPGAHQLRNAALAHALSREAPPPLGPALADSHLAAAGLAAARWPGRLERIDRRDGQDPAGGPVEIWLDAAHNGEGAAALDAWLGAAQRGRPLAVLFGAVSDKPVADMLAPAARARALVLCRPPSPRGRAPEEIVPLVHAAGYRGAPPLVVEDVAAALAAARAATPAGGLLLVYGSIFLLGEVRRLLLGEPADPRPVQDPLPRASA